MSFRIIHEDNAIFIVIKPRYCHTVSINSNNDSFCDKLFKQYSYLAEVKGHRLNEGGLLQRLDYDTEGLLLFAKSEEIFTYLVRQAKAGRFKKGYVAECEPLASYYFVPIKCDYSPFTCRGEMSIECRFVYAEKGRKKVQLRPVTTQSTKASVIYKTNISVSERENDRRHVVCSLSQGFKHQVRATLAALGLPICGDKIYNPQAIGEFKFWAVSIDLMHPLTNTAQRYVWQPSKDCY
jgi:23S rRNA pseudouridine1911/1915/1917 synthase